MNNFYLVRVFFITLILGTFFLVSFCCSSCSSYNQEPSIYDLLPEGTFTSGMEGPAVDSLGNLYAVNHFYQGTIGVVTPNGEHSIYLSLPDSSIGNGICFDKAGRMYVADYIGHNILIVEDNIVKVFAHDSLMNQPNDIAISPKSQFIYASDPNWKESTGMLWMADTLGLLYKIEEEMGTTNGIAVSPCGELLYVNESIQRIIWVYDIGEDNIPVNKRVFYSFKDFGMDGMRCDKYGNLFVARHGKGTVVMLSKKGVLLDEYRLKGKLPSNLTFSNDFSKIFVTLADRGCFEVIEF